MSAYVPGFQAFFMSFVFVKLATSSIRVNLFQLKLDLHEIQESLFHAINIADRQLSLVFYLILYWPY